MKDLDRLKRGTEKLLSADELEKKLKKGKALRIKLGVDPTAPDIHLGHTVALTKLRQFQDLGHTVVFIIGDYTARIGDPSGRSELRPPLSVEEIDKNAQTYLDQVFKILDRSKTEVHKNSQWLGPFFANAGEGLDNLNAVLARHTVQQLTERDDFSKRLKEGNPISLLELLYPIMQGYDSVKIKADVEIGGTDQLFNLLMGREMQKDAGQEPQVVMTLPLLEGTDGVKKMSKSYGNYVAVNDTPQDMFGKLMGISDELMWKYYTLLTEEDLAPLKKGHPMEAKKKLAGLITARYHGEAAAQESRDNFEKVFSKGQVPEEMEEHQVSKSPLGLVELLLEAGVAPSRNEARRLLKQGAVEWGGAKLKEEQPIQVDAPTVLKVGKRQFRRVLPL